MKGENNQVETNGDSWSGIDLTSQLQQSKRNHPSSGIRDGFDETSPGGDEPINLADVRRTPLPPRRNVSDPWDNDDYDDYYGTTNGYDFSPDEGRE